MSLAAFPFTFQDIENILKQTIPASVLKTCLPVILPTLTSIINMSLMTGIMQDALKVTVLSPLLKKQDADTEQLQNFRPISNLKFVSKLVEKAVASQLN